MDTLAYAALTVLDDLDLDQVHLAGFSYGAVIAFRIAQLHPERLRRLVLVGATPTLPDEVVARSLDVVALGEAGHADSFADQLLDLFTSADAPVRGQPVIRRMLRPAFAGASRHDVAKFAAHARRAVAQRALHPVPAPSTPTLTVTGAHDAYTTPQMCREVAELCADSWFATIGEADHMVHLGRARELGDLMLRFLSDEPLHGLPYCETVERVRAGWPDPISPDVRTRAGAVPEPL
jgi:pimeloyl-ACP methyl ester carboxylesterase